MKFHGGFIPKISGRPKGIVEQIKKADFLIVNLEQGGLVYAPLLTRQQVQLGDPLAFAEIRGGKVYLPAPASGQAEYQERQTTGRKFIRIDSLRHETKSNGFETIPVQKITRAKVCELLCRGGIWPFFWSSMTGGIPGLDPAEQPGTIIVNALCAEPFRTRGKVVLRENWDIIVEGIKYLVRLAADYGRIEIILTAPDDPVAQMMYKDLAGHAWIGFHPVSLKYPVESPRILNRVFRKYHRKIKASDAIWVIDIQGVEAVGRCLAKGMPLSERTITLGGPGVFHPTHISVQVGTPLSFFLADRIQSDRTVVLRGGLLTGSPADIREEAVHYSDDAFFCLPAPGKREFLHFIRPGFNRTSYIPCFISRLTGARDSHITFSLRGEVRPCIACGFCEKICPVDLMPQVLHRYLYRHALDEAEKTGLFRCIACGLCSYVCPSKIDLARQFQQAMQQLRTEKTDKQESDA